MKKEKAKHESPYKGIFRFASEKKQQLTFSVILSVLSSIFGIVPYIAVAVLLQSALEGRLTMEWAVLLPVIALCGFFLKHWLYAKSTLCSHKVAYEIIKNIRVAVMRKMSRVSMGTVQSKSSGEFKQLIMDDADRLEVPIAHAIPEMIASTLVPVLVILYLLLIDWRMALAALATGVIGNVIYYCIASIAEYCVREGVENTENGEWSITYEELYFQFDGTTLTSRNGMGRLLQEKLRQREEVNALIMTEDCIEMSYHLEYCPNCQRGGLAGAMNLLSLMGCNLYDLHLECGQDSEEPYLSPPLDRLTADTLTEYGKRDWADVMKAKVTGISGKHGRMTVSLTGCSAEWLRDFCGLLLGDTNQGYYEQCVAMPDMAYGKAGEQPSDLRDSRVSDLIATYEELFHVQRDERITHYFGDYGSHFFNMGVTDQEIQPVYEKALAVMEMDDAGFRSTKEFLHRGEIIGRMRDCLLAKELHPGEEVLFVGTEPYGGPGDFELRGGHIRFVDPGRKACTVRGSFFDMKDVPLRYVLGRYNAEITETHYGRPHVEVLFGEYPALAQQYLHEAEERWEQYETDAAAAPTQTM